MWPLLRCTRLTTGFHRTHHEIREDRVHRSGDLGRRRPDAAVLPRRHLRTAVRAADQLPALLLWLRPGRNGVADRVPDHLEGSDPFPAADDPEHPRKARIRR